MMYGSYIMALTRTQISLSDEDRRVLDAVAKRTGLSMSALIREAIHATYGVAGDQDRVEAALDATFGVIVTDVDGGALVDGLRSGARLA